MDEKNKTTVLIIDDEEDFVDGLTRLLRSKGFIAISALDAINAMTLIRKGGVDVVILDLAIPAGGGFLVLENIRGNLATAKLPVIVLTANTEKAVEKRAKEMGVEGYITKPFDPEVLIEEIKKNKK